MEVMLVVGNIFHASIFSPDIAGLFVFVHQMISKTYYTCPIIVLGPFLCTSRFGLVTCSEDRFFIFSLSIFFWPLLFFPFWAIFYLPFPLYLCAFGVPSVLCIPLFFPHPPTTT